MIKTIIFDLDGVIIDSSRMWTELHQKTAKFLKLRVPERKEISGLWGQSWEYIIETLWPGTDYQTFKETLREIKKREKILIRPIKDVTNILEKLNKSGYNLGLVSAGPKVSVVENLREANIDPKFFKVIVGGEDTKNHKPDPEPILHACNLLDVKPENVIYVGDSLFDYRSAKNANVEFVAVLTGEVSEGEFKKNGVKNIIASVNDLSKFLKL